MSNIAVQLAYALSTKQYLYTLRVPTGSTVAEVIQQSHILILRPEIDLTQHKVGIFGKVASLTDRVQAGDRVEIYRPLIADPKLLRRQRAAQAKSRL